MTKAALNRCAPFELLNRKCDCQVSPLAAAKILLGTAEAEFDIFALAAAGEATSEREYGLAASGAAAISDTVTINLGSRAFVEADSDLTVDTIVEAAFGASETITLTASGGYLYESDDTAGVTYGGLSLEWSPDGDFEAELSGRSTAGRAVTPATSSISPPTKSFE